MNIFKGITDSRFIDQFMVPGRLLKSAFETSLIGFLGQNWWLGTSMYFIYPPEQVLKF